MPTFDLNKSKEKLKSLFQERRVGLSCGLVVKPMSHMCEALGLMASATKKQTKVK